MRNGSIEAVIFDLGGVLIEYDFNRAFEQAGHLTGQPALAIRRRMFGKDYGAGFASNHPIIGFELGAITSREFHRRIEGLLGHPLPYGAFQELWNGIFTNEVAPTVALVGKLQQRPGLKVGVLSNTNALHMAYLRRRMTILRELKYVYASNEIRRRKPDAACFQHVFKKMKVQPRRTVFIDDFAENVNAAAALGAQVIHATGPEVVRTGLARLGLF